MAQYVITDGTRWIMRDRKGKYVPTSCEALADIFTNKQATGIFQSNLSKALKSVFRVQKIDEPPKLIKQISQETVQENTEKVSTAENVQRWIDKIEGLNGLATEALHRKDELEGNRKLINACKKNNLQTFNPQGKWNGYGYEKLPMAVKITSLS